MTATVSPSLFTNDTCALQEQRSEELIQGVRLMLAGEALGALWEGFLQPNDFVGALCSNFNLTA